MSINAKQTLAGVVNTTKLQNDLYYANETVFATLTEQDMIFNDDGTGMGNYSYKFEPLDWLIDVDSVSYWCKYVEFGVEVIRQKTAFYPYNDDGCFRDDNFSIYLDGTVEFASDMWVQLDSLELKIIKCDIKRIPGEALDLSGVTYLYDLNDDNSHSVHPRIYVPTDDFYDKNTVILGSDKLRLAGDPIFESSFPSIPGHSVTLPSINNTTSIDITLDPESIEYDAQLVSDRLQQLRPDVKYYMQIGLLNVIMDKQSLGTLTGIVVDETMRLYGVKLDSFDDYTGYTITIKRYF